MKHDNPNWQFEQGADPRDNDPDTWLTDEGECSECGYDFDISELEALFVVEESGFEPDTPNGPGYHWAVGHLVCPQCKAELPYEMS
jgi:hypothetical protein